MNLEEHKQRHKELHGKLDELVADFIDETGQTSLSEIPIGELMKWSFEQTKNPSDRHKRIKED